jgi:hypothetical protein
LPCEALRGAMHSKTTKYRAKADEIRAKAATMQDESLRQTMLLLAVDYEELAETVNRIANSSEFLKRRT